MHDILCSRFIGLHYLYVIFSDLFKADFAKDKLQDVFEGGQDKNKDKNKDKDKNKNQAGGNYIIFPWFSFVYWGKKNLSTFIIIKAKAQAV